MDTQKLFVENYLHRKQYTQSVKKGEKLNGEHGKQRLKSMANKKVGKDSKTEGKTYTKKWENMEKRKQHRFTTCFKTCGTESGILNYIKTA